MLSQTLTVILPLLAAVSAAPTVSPTSASYYLQAQPLGKNPKPIPNNYLSSYHSGAGQNIVTLVARTDATKAFIPRPIRRLPGIRSRDRLSVGICDGRGIGYNAGFAREYRCWEWGWWVLSSE